MGWSNCCWVWFFSPSSTQCTAAVHSCTAIRCDRWAGGFPLAGGRPPNLGRPRHRVALEHFRANQIATRQISSGQSFSAHPIESVADPPLQLQIKIVRDPSSCPPPPLPASNDSANWSGPQPQTGDLNYYGWKLRPVGSSLVSFARVLFQLPRVCSVPLFVPVSCVHLFYLLPNIVVSLHLLCPMVHFYGNEKFDYEICRHYH